MLEIEMNDMMACKKKDLWKNLYLKIVLWMVAIFGQRGSALNWFFVAKDCIWEKFGETKIQVEKRVLKEVEEDEMKHLLGKNCDFFKQVDSFLLFSGVLFVFSEAIDE